MEAKDYVNYEVAKLLKSKGFNKPCDSFFADDVGGGYICWGCVHELKKEVAENEYLQPTLYDAQKWLREEHKIDVLITFDLKEGTMQPLGYSFDIWQKQKEFKDFCMNFKTYEDALNEGIKRALKYI